MRLSLKRMKQDAGNIDHVSLMTRLDIMKTLRGWEVLVRSMTPLSNSNSND